MILDYEDICDCDYNASLAVAAIVVVDDDNEDDLNNIHTDNNNYNYNNHNAYIPADAEEVGHNSAYIHVSDVYSCRCRCKNTLDSALLLKTSRGPYCYSSDPGIV